MNIISVDSFKNVEFWLKDLKTNSNPDIKVFLIGSKADLEESRTVSKEMGKNLQYVKNFDYFNETSAKSGFNAKNVRNR